MIYLDNCSTTLPREEVIDLMTKSLKEDFANPSSLHSLGLKSEKKIRSSRETIAEFLNVHRDEIYFTSGGTESNNIAVQSMVKKMENRGKHIISTRIEHPSVLNTIKHYEEEGFEVSYLDVDSKGQISLEDFAKHLREDTILVSIMHVNNEIGSIEPIEKIRDILKEKNSQALFHVDGVQGFGKVDISLKDYGIDAYSFSGHKIYGPKGVGGLYIDRNAKLSPIIYGGNQEMGLRSGTENLNAIIGLGEATRLIRENFKEEREYAQILKEYMVEKINENIDDIRVNTSLDETSSPYILNISIKNIRAEVLLHYLEMEEIYISTSSACSSRGTDKSHVLKAIGLDDNYIEGTIRICFSHDIRRQDLDYTIEKMKKSVEEIRRIMMR